MRNATIRRRDALPVRWWPLAVLLGVRTPAHGWAERHPRTASLACAAALVACIVLAGIVEAA